VTMDLASAARSLRSDVASCLRSLELGSFHRARQRERRAACKLELARLRALRLSPAGTCGAVGRACGAAGAGGWPGRGGCVCAAAGITSSAPPQG